MDKAFEAIEGNSRYQKLHFVCVCAIWFCVDFIALSFPLLLYYPKTSCEIGDTGTFEECNEKDFCKIYLVDQSKVIINKERSNVLTDRELYCNYNLINFVAVVFTFGVILGAFISSKAADIIGRRTVALYSAAAFGLFTSIFTFVPNIWTTYISLVFMGACASAGTMSSFVLIYEVLNKNARNLYGTLINASYAVAGLIYYLIYYYAKSWIWISVVCMCASFCGLLMLLTYFVESPRFLYSANHFKESLKKMLRIAQVNTQENEYRNFIVESIASFQGNDNSHKSVNLDSFQDEDIDTLIDKLSSYLSHTETKSQSNLDQSATSQSEENLLQINQNKNDIGITSLCKYKSVSVSFYLCSILWVMTSYSYFGNSYIQKENIDTLFVNGFTMFSAELAAYLSAGLIMQISFMGRVRTIGYMGLISAIFAALLVFMKDARIIGEIFLFIYRFSITCVYTSLYTYCTEVYPTCIRTQGMGLNLTFARLSTVIVALTSTLYNSYIAFSVFGLLSFFIHFFLKETIGKELQETIEELNVSNAKGTNS